MVIPRSLTLNIQAARAANMQTYKRLGPRPGTLPLSDVLTDDRGLFKYLLYDQFSLDGQDSLFSVLKARDLGVWRKRHSIW